MLDIEEVFPRILSLQEFQQMGYTRDDFMLQDITTQFSLAAISGSTYGSISNQAMQFPTLAVVIGMTGGAAPVGAASTTVVKPGLDMFALGLNYNQQRTMVGPGQAIASSVFGQFNNLYPAKEIIVPTSGSIMCSLTSLVTDAITAWITAHCLVLTRTQ